jgi:hypothetical protein
VRVLVYPADQQGCGYHRLIWPGEALIRQGHDVTVIPQEDRRVRVGLSHTGEVKSVDLPPDVDVVVFQRVTHQWLSGVIRFIRERGIATVVDIDDDLTSIHPSNPAFTGLHPSTSGKRDGFGKPLLHGWQHLHDACAEATLVTVSSPALLRIYAPHGRGAVLRNVLAPHYFGIPHDDSDVIAWPAMLHAHPNDPDVVGPAVSRLVNEGAEFRIVGRPEGCGRAFMLPDDPPGGGASNIFDWPTAVAKIGIGITPLADTRFNRAKSWLKPLELAAVGVPWVGSPRTEYAALHKLGCGVLAERPKDWYRVLRDLRRDPTRRAELSHAGREVAETLRLDDHAWRWLEAWDEAYRIQTGRRSSVVASVDRLAAPS